MSDHALRDAERRAAAIDATPEAQARAWALRLRVEPELARVRWWLTLQAAPGQRRHHVGARSLWQPRAACGGAAVAPGSRDGLAWSALDSVDVTCIRCYHYVAVLRDAAHARRGAALRAWRRHVALAAGLGLAYPTAGQDDPDVLDALHAGLMEIRATGLCGPERLQAAFDRAMELAAPRVRRVEREAE